MGKLDVKMMRYLNKEDFRVLTAIEMGMKNHELVSQALVAQIANLRHGGLHKILKELCKHRLLCYENTKHYEGYRLTNTGYDYLALKTLTARELIDCFGNQIGVGKESNIYVVSKNNEFFYCLKLHRLGRTCFRQVKTKRDYHQHRKYMSWLYLSRISATKEFAYMKALYDRGFPVPKPIDFNRHCIIMELINGVPLCNVHQVDHVEQLYDELMNIICKLAYCGVIHGDFNEFNIMLTPEEKPILIDFPQMISTENEEAQLYFERDVNCIREFFRRRFAYESTMYPIFKNIVKEEIIENKKSSKVLLHSPTVSDYEDELSDYNDEEPEENKNIDTLKEKLLELNIDSEQQLLLTTDEHLQTNDIHKNCENETSYPNEPSSSIYKFLKSTSTNITEQDISDENQSLTNLEVIEETNSSDDNKSFDLRSTTSTCIPEAEVRKKIKQELLKRRRKLQSKKNLKKSTTSTKNRRENRSIARENVGFWVDD